ncbi:MAG: hypothetical protein RLZZ399_1819 [Verrucomicrobiota bacterium]
MESVLEGVTFRLVVADEGHVALGLLWSGRAAEQFGEHFVERAREVLGRIHFAGRHSKQACLKPARFAVARVFDGLDGALDFDGVDVEAGPFGVVFPDPWHDVVMKGETAEACRVLIDQHRIDDAAGVLFGGGAQIQVGFFEFGMVGVSDGFFEQFKPLGFESFEFDCTIRVAGDGFVEREPGCQEARMFFHSRQGVFPEVVVRGIGIHAAIGGVGVRKGNALSGMERDHQLVFHNPLGGNGKFFVRDLEDEGFLRLGFKRRGLESDPVTSRNLGSEGARFGEDAAQGEAHPVVHHQTAGTVGCGAGELGGGDDDCFGGRRWGGGLWKDLVGDAGGRFGVRVQKRRGNGERFGDIAEPVAFGVGGETRRDHVGEAEYVQEGIGVFGPVESAQRDGVWGDFGGERGVQPGEE